MCIIAMWIICQMHWIVPLTALGCFINTKITKTFCKTRRGTEEVSSSVIFCFFFPFLNCDSVLLLPLNESLE
ncbi:hypothetical protein Lalb_Chr01g0010041 [Lupinus albus]|uniref:Uncharacterized protein n=1 Tax=Lupinus albus TaxID=3870 RepID=A0A6A4R4X3_LUPAL|nr:hypothetical protein Lalb_Chr01g0010041 [Lupinus albus]